MKILTIASVPLLLLSSSSSLYAFQDTQQGSEQKSQAEQEKPVEDNDAPSIFDPDAEVQAGEPSAAANAALDMIDKALKNIDEDIKREGTSWAFQIGGTQILIVSDPVAERMRIMIPILDAESLNPEILERLMQANFDSALDARYAIANGLLWGTYIHPLTNLDEDQFLSGLAQTLSIVQTFGSSFSSGTVVFGGGDSRDIVDEEVEEQEKEKEASSFT